ncbi:MAG: transcription antitermination factor NusB [Candidatus Marinimicrobia bacterium]|nr:transcription antitermination factor NusB [Candidatus Neomarinimicrobiota bacterium]MDA0753140.1 transcription antitermination factor NusB [Candidatus Neomarinimicrobiota bacterium]MDA1363200.1 transcription antitermination factor NusB [Candidatus Neomarinimicrobiota bacterium]
MAKSDKQQRRLAREAVLQALYAKHISNEEAKKVLHDILIRYEFDKMTKKFVEELFNSTIKFSDDLDKHIESSLDNWTIDRLNVIDRLIMQMSLCEMIHLKSYDISHKVTISSAIENAKKFSSEDSTSFVNGVLDSIYKEL